MHLFYDSTLNTWRLITEKLPEKPKVEDNFFLCYQYNAAIAALKQNALTVGNIKLAGWEYKTIYKGETERKTWCRMVDQCFEEVKPDELYSWPGSFEVKEIHGPVMPEYDAPSSCYKFAILTLPEEKTLAEIDNEFANAAKKCIKSATSITLKVVPEEKKNTMENMTKEQQRVEFDKHRKEIEKIILGCRGIQSRQVHWSEAVPMVAMYITKELEKFSHPTTSSGSVAAPKEEQDLKVLQDRFKNDYANEIFKQENRSLRQQLKEREESIKELLPIIESILETRIAPKRYSEMVSRTKALLDKPI